MVYCISHTVGFQALKKNSDWCLHFLERKYICWHVTPNQAKLVYLAVYVDIGVALKVSCYWDSLLNEVWTNHFIFNFFNTPQSWVSSKRKYRTFWAYRLNQILIQNIWENYSYWTYKELFLVIIVKMMPYNSYAH